MFLMHDNGLAELRVKELTCHHLLIDTEYSETCAYQNQRSFANSMRPNDRLASHAKCLATFPSHSPIEGWCEPSPSQYPLRTFEQHQAYSSMKNEFGNWGHAR